ncbi:MAG: hypothetical protein J6A75_08895 [Lachnospiraceae bacterium]|nr:hypothetical protein [Lachnospiraceae bacterium]
MTDIRKQQFHTVENNLEEMEKKLRKHRRKIAIRITVLVILASVSLAATAVYFQQKEYTDYEVRSEIKKADSEATQYEDFAGYILRYNNDGAFCADLSDNLIWNQAYEMQTPMVDICETYAAIADKHGTQIYIMDTVGVQGKIETSKPIQAICVANQGSVAVLTQEEGTSNLELYNKKGESLASGEIHVENSGYPLDIALSNDANKLAVSILDISQGKAKTNIVFYNFGSVGQNEIDNMVGSYSYKDTVIPEIDFVTNERMLAFGDSRIVIFEGTQKPEETAKLELKKEVKSLFFDEEYIGLVYGNSEEGNSHKMHIYDMTGKLRLEKSFKMAYQNIEFLKNHEICIIEDNSCILYTLRGVKKFTHTFDAGIHKILSGQTSQSYTFILSDVMEKVKLK